MKKLAILCTIFALCTGHTLLADNDKNDGKKVPPGLQKKGGVPPGQAKKKAQSDDATPDASSAPANAPVSAPAATPASAPAPANTTTTTATPAPAPLVAKPAATTPAKPTTLAEQKAALETHARAINQATKSNPLTHKMALAQIAKQTGVTLDHLKEQDTNFPAASDTGLLLGNVIARKANVRFSDVIQARQSGKQWDEIAKAHNVDFGLLVQKSSELAQALRGH